jgi:iron complex outermembrane recepter protein
VTSTLFKWEELLQRSTASEILQRVGGQLVRTSVAIAAAFLLIIGVSSGRDAQASFRQPTNIASQPLMHALNTLAKERNVQLVYRSELIEERHTGGASGNLTFEEALTQLLTGTGLTFKYLDSRAVTIVDSSSVEASTTQPTTQPKPSPGSAARALPGGNAGSRESSSNGDREPARLDEVVVSAEKRLENVLTVPVSVTALSVNTLAQQGKVRLADYYSSVPGLDFAAGSTFGGGQQTITIRGLATAALSNSTVAVLIDDVPFGSSTFLGLGSVSYPDIDPGTLSQIEVLRGPQGTLYGASSIGGVIKFDTLEPSTEHFSGQMRLGSEWVDHGGVGYDTSASVNIPVSAEVGLQASAFIRRQPGYIDNVLSGERNVNQADIGGGRLAALWQATDAVSVKVSGLFQSTDGNGSSAVDTDINLHPVYGDLKQSRLPGTERYRTEDGLYAVTVKARLTDDIDLTSISGYGTIHSQQSPDSSLISLGATEALFGVGGASQSGSFVETKRFTQEIRLAAKINSSFDWIAGAFFNDERSRYFSVLNANEADTGAFVGNLANYDTSSSLKEYSLFGDLTVHFTDRFDVQLGGREAKIKQRYDETDTGPFVTYLGQSSPNIVPTEHAEGRAFTYLVTPRLRISPELMVFARFASGYRPGGPNVNAQVSGNPLTFEPDKTYSYELGAKGTLFDGVFTFDASVYYIDWKNIQIQLDNVATFSSYIANAGGARSDGAEVSLGVHPAKGLTLAATMAWNAAELTGDLPMDSDAIGVRHDRLPYSSKFSGTLSADQEIPLTGSVTGFFGGSVSYVGDRLGEFATTASPVRLTFPSYVSFDVRTGAHVGPWSLDLFCSNVADRRGVVGGTATGASGTGINVIYLQPRTVGLSLSRFL